MMSTGESIAVWTFISIFIGLPGLLIACSFDSDHDVKVKGGTQNTVELSESFCDPATYPTQPERKECKDKLLEAMKCR